MELQELVIEIIHHLKKGPFAEIVVTRGIDFAAGPTPIINREEWFRKELIKFNSKTESLLKELESKAESCEDYILVKEQHMKLSDAKDLLRKNMLLSDTSIQINGLLSEEEIVEYKLRIERIQLFIDAIEKKMKVLDKVSKPEEALEFDFEKEGLTEELKIGSIEISKSGAHIAFMLHVLRRAGWFKNYQHEFFDKIFAEFLEQNLKYLQEKEYYFLKSFMSTISHVKNFKYDDFNKSKIENFQAVLKEVIEDAQKTFLEDESTYHLYKR